MFVLMSYDILQASKGLLPSFLFLIDAFPPVLVALWIVICDRGCIDRVLLLHEYLSVKVSCVNRGLAEMTGLVITLQSQCIDQIDGRLIGELELLLIFGFPGRDKDQAFVHLVEETQVFDGEIQDFRSDNHYVGIEHA